MIQLKRGTASEWSDRSDIVLDAGQLGAEMIYDGISLSEVRLKLGDGLASYQDLPYIGDGVYAKLNDESQTIYTGNLNVNYKIESNSVYTQCIYPYVTGGTSPHSSISIYSNNLELAGDVISVVDTERAESYDLVNLVPEERYIAYYHPWSNVSSSNNLTVTCRRWGNVVHTQFEGLLHTGSKVAQSISEITLPEKYRPILTTRSCEFGLSSNNVVSYNTWWIESDGRVFLVSTSGSAYEVHASFCYLC